MSPQNYFFIIFIITVILTRLGVYFSYEYTTKNKKQKYPEPYILGIRIHHYMYGIVLIIIGTLIKNITIYAIGLGLFIDELPFNLLRGKSHKDNYSLASNLGGIILTAIVFFTQDYILFFK